MFGYRIFPHMSSLFSPHLQATELNTWPQGKVHTHTHFTRPVDIQSPHSRLFQQPQKSLWRVAAHRDETFWPQDVLMWNPLWLCVYSWTQKTNLWGAPSRCAGLYIYEAPPGVMCRRLLYFPVVKEKERWWNVVEPKKLSRLQEKSGGNGVHEKKCFSFKRTTKEKQYYWR